MLTTRLFPYQDEAVDMLLDNDGGLVAYEMGLGKTVVAIAYAEELLGDDWINHALIVVPSGLRWQWAQAIARFTDVDTVPKKVKKETITVPDPRHCVVIDGSPAKRKEQYALVREHSPDYVIVSYEILTIDFKTIKGLRSDLVVLDECTAIKSFKAQRTKKVKRLEPDFRVGLTGTPVENRPEELFSIMEFCAPGFLGRFDLFDQAYIVRNHWGSVLRYKNLDVLYRKMRKVMSRKTRLDPDVAPHMPDVQHSEKHVSLSTKAARLYRQIATELVGDLREMQASGDFDIAAHYRGEEDNSAQGKVMAKVIALRQLCDHPALLYRSAEKCEDGVGGSKFVLGLQQAGMLDIGEDSEKLETVVTDICDILDSHPENKVIVFSQFREMISLLSLKLPMWDHVIYTGAMSSTEKEEAKTRFKTNADCRVILCSDAGGYGLDLPEANYLLNVDLPESAGTFAQRNARHVRAGSKHKNVYVVNYLTEGTVEERVFQRLKFKQSIADAILDGKVSFQGEIENDVDTLTTHLVEMADRKAS